MYKTKHLKRIIGVVSSLAVMLVSMLPGTVSATETLQTKMFTAGSAYEYYADNLNLTWSDLAVSGDPFQTSIANSIMLADHGGTFNNGYTCATATSIADAQNLSQNGDYQQIYANYKRGQSFTALGTGGCQYVTLKIARVGNPGDLQVILYAYGSPTSLGAVLGSITTPQAQIGTTTADYQLPLGNPSITQGQKYVIMAYCPTGNTSNYYKVFDSNSNPYSGGTLISDDGSQVWESNPYDYYFRVTRTSGLMALDDYYRNVMYFNLDGLLDTSKIRSIEIVLHQSGTIYHKTKAVLVWNPANLESQTDGRWFMANAYSSTDYNPLGQTDADKGANGIHTWDIVPTEWDLANQTQWLNSYLDDDNNLRVGMILENAMIGYPSYDSYGNVLWSSGDAYIDEWLSPGCSDIPVGGETVKVEPYIIVNYVNGAFFVPPPETTDISDIIQIIPNFIDNIGEQDSGVRWLIMLAAVAAAIALCWRVQIMAIVTPLLVVGAFIAMGWIDIWLVLLLAALGAFIIWQTAGGKRLVGGDG
ncbi:hypothetical protein [Dehalococcoides mccartyi]|uniref:hypothetical protein n=1 Tax=Dehalococcoides mccartyi TaxID=61435 RepID=UPI0006BE0564|nr:hypothetical protein [Dehalococcoides mccartyi]BAS31149.1 hypothetical protein IBK_0074 [Dehalococcoides mccartyi IBARAKI]